MWEEVLDVEAAYQYLTDQAGVDAHQVGLFGNSMGGAIAILYASEHPEIYATIAQSPYNSYQDEIWYQTRRAKLPAFLMAPLIELWMQRKFEFSIDEISPLRKIKQISPNAVFILQGGQDVMLDTKQAGKLYAAAGEPKIYWYDESVKHIDFQQAMGAEFERRVIEFYDQYLIRG